ncbi:hypothetical protein OH77DRAFT_1428969 [Trametes cingulata]|nr:hypothetical protein OH77DRAFT_1428969 [Trametes cingulata]
MSIPGGRIVYMNVPANRGDKDESFEERRYLDYLHAYQTTGRPPPPCPPAPTDPKQRAALGLPPLFEPLVEGAPLVNGVATTSSSPVVPGPVAAPNFLAQAFVPTKIQEYGSDTHFHSIVAQQEYSKYSFEELRLEAYKAGKKYVNVPPPPPPQVQRPSLLPAPSISSSVPSDSLLSINSMPPYDQHSFEELRLAFMRAGRPLTSPEIIAQNAILRLTV